MLTAEIRRRFLAHFEHHGHTVAPSASVVSPDPSTLFVIAGMVPFIPYLTGQQKPPFQRAASVQKCVRTLDIEEVGKTTRHGTFFQMCGNFSFGDYFKEGAITLAWELITKSTADGGLGFDPDRMWVTVLHEDDEAFELWHKLIGIPTERIQRRDRNDNYWHTGQPGPGGPCSEIYFDRGPAYGAEGGPIVDEDRYLEIWNLVFMQHQLREVRSKVDFDIAGDLPHRNIDTGMGLERVAYLLQGKDNLYEIDEVFPVMAHASQMAGVKYGANPDHDVRFRVVGDHVRSGLMIMGDGVVPSNEGRGYVLRRLLRRVVRSMRLLGVDGATLVELLTVSKDLMKQSYPELQGEWSKVEQVAAAEEEAFKRTLSAGTTILDTAVQKAKAEAGGKPALIGGSSAFQLHDTYGFPIELTLEMAQEHGVNVDEPEFRRLMQEQRDRAKADARAKKAGSTNVAAYQEVAERHGRSVDFTGYTETAGEGQIVAVFVDGEPGVATAGDAVEVVLDRTPFYAEGGGQLADHGTIELADGTVIRVHDVQKPFDGMVVHRAEVVSGEVRAGSAVRSQVDVARRRSISRAHTATHILHKAIRESLGESATQAGSENAPGRFRFDFHANSALAGDTLQEVESRINHMLAEDLSVTATEMTQEEAMADGAMALFGEKYGDSVRVISVGEWSKELCGGTHAASSGQIGVVTLLSEQSIGSGVRRIEALVGTDAHAFLAREHALVTQLTSTLKVRPDELADRISAMMTQLKEAEKELNKIRLAQLIAGGASIADGAQHVGQFHFVTHDAGVVSAADDVRALVMDVRNRMNNRGAVVVAVAAVAGDRPLVIVATNEAARELGAKAGALVKTAAGVLGGGGGGKPDMAQGGGQDPKQIPDALAAIQRDIAAL